MPLTKKQITLIVIGLIFILGLILLFVFGGRQEGKGQLSGKITFWGVFDEPNVMNEIIAAYQATQPKVEIVYKKLDPAGYETDLVNALATAKGPDVFMFFNSWLPKHYDKIQPLTESQLPIATFRRLFPTVVEQDFAPDGVIYALPLYIDTLAMFYNRDIFDSKGIALPPKTWLEFQNLLPKIREIDKTGKILKAAAAIGGSNKSINQASGLLNLLMLQSGVQMVNQDFSGAAFGQEGLPSLKFYTQFSNPTSPFYTWNESLPYSIDSFAEGQTAVIFNYSHQVKLIKEKNPFLNFVIAPMLQPENANTIINWPNYWGLAVSAKSNQAAIAWNFILWLTTDEKTSAKYLELTGKPPALRSLISSYVNNPDLGVFAQQTLTARSWPQIDNITVDRAFSEMIENTIAGKVTPDKAIQQAEDKISELMAKRLR